MAVFLVNQSRRQNRRRANPESESEIKDEPDVSLSGSELATVYERHELAPRVEILEMATGKEWPELNAEPELAELDGNACRERQG